MVDFRQRRWIASRHRWYPGRHAWSKRHRRAGNQCRHKGAESQNLL